MTPGVPAMFGFQLAGYKDFAHTGINLLSFEGRVRRIVAIPLSIILSRYLTFPVFNFNSC